MEIWYNAPIDDIIYEYDEVNSPDTLRLTRKYNKVKFDPTSLEEIRIKINQMQNTKLLNFFGDLEKAKFIADPTL